MCLRLLLYISLSAISLRYILIPLQVFPCLLAIKWHGTAHVIGWFHISAMALLNAPYDIKNNSKVVGKSCTR